MLRESQAPCQLEARHHPSRTPSRRLSGPILGRGGDTQPLWKAGPLPFWHAEHLMIGIPGPLDGYLTFSPSPD